MNKSLVGFYAPVEWKVNGITFGANLLAWTGMHLSQVAQSFLNQKKSKFSNFQQHLHNTNKKPVQGFLFNVYEDNNE